MRDNGLSLVRVFFSHVGFDGKAMAGNSVLLRSPGAEIGELAAFGAEGAPGIAFPRRWLTAERTGHAGYFTTRAGVRLRLAWADLITGFGLKQSVQATLIYFRDPDEFDAKLPMLTPTHRGGFDRDRRPQVGGANKEPDG